METQQYFDFISQNWSQLTIFIGIIGYFGKELFSLFIRKKEINHKFYQERKINAVSNFLSAYTQAEYMINNMPEYDIYNKVISANEIDNYVNPPLHNLEKATHEIHIYFKDDIYEYYEAIKKNITEINTKMKDIYSSVNPNYKSITKACDFYEIKNSKLTKNNELISLALKKARKELE